MDDKNIQGKEDAQAVVAEVTQKAEELQKRDLTTSERLNKFFDQPGASYGEEGQKPPTPPQAAESKQPEPVPSSEKTEQKPQVQQPAKQPERVEAKEDEHVLPDGASERTREQFEKLKEENRRLKEEKKHYGSSVFDEFRPGAVAPQQQQPPMAQYPGNAPVVPQQALPPIPPIILPYQGANQQPNGYSNLNPQQVEQITQQFVDAQGNVDINGLNNALVMANRRAQLAEQSARVAQAQATQAQQNIVRFEEDQQVREAHAAVPEIDPNSKSFDPELFDLVRDRILNNMYQGKKERLVDIATSLKKFKGNATPKENPAKIADEAVTQYKEAQKARDQMPLESGVGSPRQTASYEDARKITRKGGIDNPALDARMRKLGILS